jgi:hypothetical protein
MDKYLFAKLLAQVESNNNPTAWGDRGQAMGRFQVHPAWMWDWADQPRINMTWDEWAEAAVFAFFDAHPGLNPRLLMMQFHIGHAVTPTGSEWDDAYAKRWDDAVRKAAVGG